TDLDLKHQQEASRQALLLVPIANAKMKEAWDAYRQERGSERPATEVREWHGAAALDAEVAEQWYPMAWHLSRLINEKPDPTLHPRRAGAYEEPRQWRGALADLQAAARPPAPPSARLLNRMADVHFTLGEWGAAVSRYTQALELTD